MKPVPKVKMIAPPAPVQVPVAPPPPVAAPDVVGGVVRGGIEVVGAVLAIRVIIPSLMVL